MRAPLLARASALLVATAVAGCIAFVNDDPSTLSTTCTFSGADTACGQCVSSRCAKPLGDCCGDATCTDVTLPLLSSCFGSGALCSSLLSGSPDLASCIQSSCAGCSNAVVTGDGAVAPTSDAGSTNCYSEGDSCYCSVGSPNGAVCGTAGIKGGGLCCATYGWPSATNASCSCQPFSCTPSSLGGNCQLGPDSSGTTTWPGPGCCSYGTFCYCEPTITCTETPVAQCDVTQVGCDSDQVQVESCSF